MALFTDGPISSAADLAEYETSVLNVASAEGIDAAAKAALAQQDLANEIILFLLRRASYRNYWPNYRRQRGVSDVVVTDALRQWHVHKTLAMVYRDAYNNQLNDRYQGKWNEYEQLSKASARTYFRLGVGLVADPIVKAPAPSLSSVAGAGSGGTFYMAATWVNSGGVEGAPSDVAQLAIDSGSTLMAEVAGAPENVVGWNAYAGLSPSALTRQNDQPLSATSTWSMGGALITGSALPAGQTPNWFVVDHGAVERG